MREDWDNITKQTAERAINALYDSKLLEARENADGTTTLVLRNCLKSYRNPKFCKIRGKNGADEEGVPRYSDRGQAVFYRILQNDDAKWLQSSPSW